MGLLALIYYCVLISDSDPAQKFATGPALCSCTAHAISHFENKIPTRSVSVGCGDTQKTGNLFISSKRVKP